jgi:hypothetical protein
VIKIVRIIMSFIVKNLSSYDRTWMCDSSYFFFILNGLSSVESNDNCIKFWNVYKFKFWDVKIDVDDSCKN